MGFVKYDQDGFVGVITINRPEALNALNTEVIQDLDAVLDSIDLGTTRVLVVTGAGEKSFVAGADIAAMSTMTVQEAREFSKAGNDVFRKLETLPIPSIAAVNGFALGGGCEISMACDIRIASDNAKFGQPETGLGILPGFGGTQRLARLVGKGRAKELIFTCDMIDANEAYRIGLANKVVPQAELLDTCKAMAEKIMSKGSYAISLAKEAINTGTETDLSSGLTLEADLFGLAFSTDDKKEGMTAFLEKRKANLTDF